MPSVAFSSSTDGATLVAAPGVGKRIELLGFLVTATDTVQISFDSNTTPLTYVEAVAGGGALLPPSTQHGLICAENVALKLGLSAAETVSGHVTYRVV